MIIRLGYVAICKTLNLSASKTITYSNYKKLGESAEAKMDSIIKENFKILKDILKFNYDNDIYFYRMSHKLIPLATHDLVDYDYVSCYRKNFLEIGNLIKKYGIRVDTHPDQFCVLNSDKRKVVADSINILRFHSILFKNMGIDGKTVLHVGGAYGDKGEALIRFKENFRLLDDALKRMIILENDDKIFDMVDVLNLCEELDIPMVLDYHHYKCCNNGEDIERYLPRILNTWKGCKAKMHFSSPKNSKEKRNHSDYINVKDFIDFLNILKKFDTDIDVMLECKEKDEALFRLIRQLKYYGFNVVGTSIIL